MYMKKPETNPVTIFTERVSEVSGLDINVVQGIFTAIEMSNFYELRHLRAPSNKFPKKLIQFVVDSAVDSQPYDALLVLSIVQNSEVFSIWDNRMAKPYRQKNITYDDRVPSTSIRTVSGGIPTLGKKR